MIERDRLEAELLQAYDRRYPARARRPARLAPWLAAAALAAVLLLASRAPAEYGVDLGQRVEVRAPAGADLPAAAELDALIADSVAEIGRGPRTRQIEVRLQRDSAGATVLRIDVWGAPIEGLVERLRARVPWLGSADVQVQLLAGRVRTSVAGLLGHRLLKLGDDPAALEAARRELASALDVSPGDIGVHVEHLPGGQTRTRIEVNRHRER